MEAAERAILFVGITDSTRIYESLGDGIMCMFADPGQVLTNEQALEALDPELRERCRKLFPIRVKGRVEEVTAYEVLCRTDPDLTEANILRPAQGQMVSRLSYGGDSISVRHDAAPLRLGRDKENDVVVTSDYASRFHARIVPRGRHFIRGRAWRARLDRPRPHRDQARRSCATLPLASRERLS